MRKPPKDMVRAQAMKLTPKAPSGMKKHWNTQKRVVEYVPKTPRELLRKVGR